MYDTNYELPITEGKIGYCIIDDYSSGNIKIDMNDILALVLLIAFNN